MSTLRGAIPDIPADVRRTDACELVSKEFGEYTKPDTPDAPKNVRSTSATRLLVDSVVCTETGKQCSAGEQWVSIK
jgi:hypothetical protein